MRILFLLFLCWFVSFSLSAQTFWKQGGGQLHQTEDGGYLTCDGLRSYDRFGDLLTDSTRVVTFRTMACATTSDNGHVLVAEDNLIFTDLNDILVQKIDGDGIIEWTVTYGEDGLSENPNDIIATSDGGYMITGGISKPDSTSIGGDRFEFRDKAFFLKLNQNGVVEWFTTMQSSPLGSITDYNALYIQESDDQGFVALILHQSDSRTSASGDDVILAKVSSVGDSLWIQSHFGGLVSVNTDINSFEKTQDDGYLYTGWMDNFVIFQRAFILKASSTGVVEFIKQPISRYSHGDVAIQTSNGGYLLGGRTEDETEMNEFAFLYRFDQNGDSLWVKYGGPFGGISLIETNDGGFLYSSAGPPKTFIKTDAQGCVVNTIIEVDQIGPYCVGNSLTLNLERNEFTGIAGFEFKDILWSTGATTESIEVTTSGDYFVQFTDYNDCIRKSDTLSIVFEEDLGVQIDYGTGTFICAGDTKTLDAGPGFDSYLWSTGATTQTIEVSTADNYYVEVTKATCFSTSDTVSIVVLDPFQEQKICLVTVDPVTGKNMIVWEQNPDIRTSLYNLYRETNVSEVYELIGSVPSNEESVFLDDISDPLTKSESYKITAIDSCNNESPLSEAHKTIHLLISIGAERTVNLIWDEYLGVDFGTYNIYRGTDPNNLVLLDQVSSSVRSYTDRTPLDGSPYYQIGVQLSQACDSGSPGGRSTAAFTEALSNLQTITVTGIEEISKSNEIELFPNPGQEFMTIRLSETLQQPYSLSVLDFQGRLVKQFDNLRDRQITLQAEDFNQGAYLLKVMDNSGRQFQSKILW